uniref:Putative hsp90 co-chaperone p23 n=1 Tax=Nyssomyia neivai TaxID=330878 RepID=A0A1L8DU62_9DIPT
MSPGATTTTPPVIWAQRNDLVYLTINVECKDPEHKFTENTMSFKGTGAADNKQYEISFTFFKNIIPDKVSRKDATRCVEFTIPKAESGPYWSTLTNDKKKPHWLKVDFNKWKDEGSDDEMEGGPEFDGGDFDGDLSNLMFKSDGKDKPSFGDLDDEEDSDDGYPGLE